MQNSLCHLGFLAVLVSSVGPLVGTRAETVFLNLARDISCGDVPHGISKDARIVGGHVAASGEFPFLASIQNDEGRHFCSAFIVSNQMLLSAAHCFIGVLYGSEVYKSYELLVGSNDWKDNRNASNLYKISSVTLHPEYSYLKPNVENDIAILKVNRPIQWSSTVQPVCLARANSDHDFGTIPGWGIRTRDEQIKDWLKGTSHLHKVTLPIWTNTACQSEYRKHRINWNTKPSHICAGFQQQGMDTCEGDSGSPLLVESDGKAVAFGIVSVGEGCATRLPGIYTRISSYVDWIEANL